MKQEVDKCDNSNKIRGYRECYVAFIDMLGFSKRVEESIGDWELFKTLRDNLCSEVTTANHTRPDEVRSYQFSDSIVISTRNDQQGLKEIIQSAYLICDKLLYYQILTRGGITKGKIYDDSKVIFGPGLIRAYRIEKDIAIYPRIVMDRCIYREVKKISYNESHFRRDFDARYHLDILKLGPFWYGNLGDVSVGYNGAPIMSETKEGWLRMIKQFIEEQLVKQKDNTSIVNKYVWMAMYFNSFLRKSDTFDITTIKSPILRRLL